MFFKYCRRIVGASAALLIILSVISQLSCDGSKTALEECRREADSLRTDMQVLLDSLSKSIELDRRYFRGPIKLFYFNVDSARAYGVDGPLDSMAVLPVERSLPPTRTPIEDAIELWIAGELTEEEKAAGFVAPQFNSVRLVRSVLHNGVLYLEFDDPKYETSGGATRVHILWSEIRKTVLQFPQVREVGFPDGEEFQP